MFRIPKSVLSSAAVVIAAGMLLVVPRAAHAVAATLVQVVNTAANPAITQDTSKQASQIVTLVCNPVVTFPSSSACIQVDGHGQYSQIQPYAVPPTASLVITGLDYDPNGAPSGQGTLSILDQTNAVPIDNAFENIGVPNFSLPLQVQFPSGIVLAGTARPAIVLSIGSTNPFIYLHGYLTSN